MAIIAMVKDEMLNNFKSNCIMKVKDLKFFNGEAGLFSYIRVAGFCFDQFKDFRCLLIEKRSSRSYYVYAHRYGYAMCSANWRVSANDSISDVLASLLK